MDDDKTANNDSGIDDTAVLPAQYRVTKIQSMTNISATKPFLAYDGTDEDQVDSGLDEKQQPFPMNGGPFATPVYRMKSLGNLSQYERSFGDTPKDLMKLKAEFEQRRFGLARRRSLTNLLTEDESVSLDMNNDRINRPKPRESIFNTKPALINGSKYRKKIGIGDTKYIGNEEPDGNKQYQLTKMKSLGTIPDLLTERIGFEPFLTPSANRRRYPASLHDYRGGDDTGNGSSGGSGGDAPPMGDSSSDGDDETFLRPKPKRQNGRLRYIDEINLLNGPFERGFRRSYNNGTSTTHTNKVTSPFRQSDGYFHMPLNFPVLRPKQQRHKSGGDLKMRSSLHSLSSSAPPSSPNDGRADIIRYGSQQQQQTHLKTRDTQPYKSVCVFLLFVFWFSIFFLSYFVVINNINCNTVIY